MGDRNMSGPKVSIYSLTGRRKEIVYGQIRCEQESLACADLIRAALRHIQSFQGNLDQLLENVRLMQKRKGTGNMDAILWLMANLEKEVSAVEQGLLSNMPHKSKKYWITEKAYEEKKAELQTIQAMYKRIQKVQDALDKVLEQDQENRASLQESILHDMMGTGEDQTGDTTEEAFLRRDSTGNVRAIERSILDDLRERVSFELSDEPDPEIKRFAQKQAGMIQALQSLRDKEYLTEEVRQGISQAMARLRTIKDGQELKTFDAITVAALKERCRSCEHEAAQKRAEMENRIARYRALCDMADEPPAYLSGPEPTETELEDEIKRLEQAVVRRREQTYISECVDEVMAEMGYDMIGRREVHKKSGKTFRNELYTFREGTAVNVTYASDGQISMELGGLTEKDAIPTETEKEFLVGEMETFCGEFAEFERRMRERGIIVGKRIALAPPCADYAAMINVNDYDLEKEAQIVQMNTHGKQRTIGERKAMRSDD